jgi:Aromatic-ring-opening dioxygenase LigAB, LigA subunit
MSLYKLQKFLFDINRDRDLQREFRAAAAQVLSRYDLSGEERTALEAGDIGLIYVLGANGQLLMHYAALLGMPWEDYIAALRAGIARHGPVRAGVYTMTTRLDEKAAGV